MGDRQCKHQEETGMERSLRQAQREPGYSREVYCGPEPRRDKEESHRTLEREDIR